MAVMQITSDNFEQEVVNNEKPVILDFWATWCGPCKMQGPVFDDAEKAFSGKAAFGKVNVDEQQALAQKFGVMSIPTLILLKKGEVVKKEVGFQSLEEIEKLLS